MNTTTIKVWTTLGLGTVLGACGVGADPEVRDSDTPVASVDAPATDSAGSGPASSGEAGEGEAGEGGEGEGGVDISSAATDPVVYRSALAIAEAHILAGRDAYAVGRTDAAAEMFAHPVSEVLAEMGDVFAAQGVTDFTGAFLDASDAAYGGASVQDINDRVDAMIETLRGVAQRAPDSELSDSEIAARVVADQIDRAADMYAVAQGSDAYEPYLDGYGFYKVAEAAYREAEAEIEAAEADASAAIEQALAALAQAYPAADRPNELTQNAGELSALASRVMLSL